MPGGRFREFYYWDAYWIVKVVSSISAEQLLPRLVSLLPFTITCIGKGLLRDFCLFC